MITFTGKRNKFIVQCTDHPNAPLTKKPPTIDMLNGNHVTCTKCGATGLVYEDEGIYKLIDNDPSISISIK